jgi:hypothetical protein
MVPNITGLEHIDITNEMYGTNIPFINCLVLLGSQPVAK